MNKKISQIKNSETPPKVIKNIFNKNEIAEFLKLYSDLPTTVHNKKQNVIKKRWLQGYNVHLEKIFCERLKKEIGDFKIKFCSIIYTIRVLSIESCQTRHHRSFPRHCLLPTSFVSHISLWRANRELKVIFLSKTKQGYL